MTIAWNALAARLETPAVLVDRARLDANIHRMQAKAAALGVALRPHAKSHKSVEVARLQLAAGAVGLTVATVEEACAFLQAGISSLTMAYPQPQSAKLDRCMALAIAQGAELQFVADGLPVLTALADAAARHPRSAANAHGDSRWGVFLKVDVGLGRCGVAPESGVLVELAQAISRFPALRLAGILSHAGHAYAAADRQGVAAIAGDETLKMALARMRLEDAGFPPPVVSVGATPTALAAESFPGQQELRPGNYVFLDLQAVRLGLATLDDPALWVLATVVSRNWKYCILDAGSKTLSSDAGPHGMILPADADADADLPRHGLAFPLRLESPGDADGYPIVKLSEEHAFMVHHGIGPRVGEQVRILPAHACSVANLTEQLTVIHTDGRLEAWPVLARPGRATLGEQGASTR
ncbi:MAG: alanine racemase [Desulfovibrio sp.]|nr:alanine racemase [Desulfovibrio sp.]MCA1986016.1 alanine racemase [Desulfovibrio sp.]